MMKRPVLLLATCLVSQLIYAQWTKQDSINLQRLLTGEKEIKLNPGVRNMIDFGKESNVPLSPKQNPGLKYDETLPAVYPDKQKVKLTLNPYSIYTPHNYDPIHQKVIKPDVLSEHMKPYTNWARTWRDASPRRSREEIEATGVRYNIMGNRLNNKYVNTYSFTQTAGSIPLGGGVTVTTTGSGSAIGGLDLMKPFTKEFWDRKGTERRERTLEVLQAYGDSTTSLIPEEVYKLIPW